MPCGCKKATYVGKGACLGYLAPPVISSVARGKSLGYLPPPVKSSASLGEGWVGITS